MAGPHPWGKWWKDHQGNPFSWSLLRAIFSSYRCVRHPVSINSQGKRSPQNEREQNREMYRIKNDKICCIPNSSYLVLSRYKIQGIVLLLSGKRKNTGVHQKIWIKGVNTSHSFCIHLHRKKKGVKKGIFRLIIFLLELSDSITLNKGRNYFSKWIKLMICVCVWQITVLCCGRPLI